MTRPAPAAKLSSGRWRVRNCTPKSVAQSGDRKSRVPGGEGEGGQRLEDRPAGKGLGRAGTAADHVAGRGQQYVLHDRADRVAEVALGVEDRVVVAVAHEPGRVAPVVEPERREDDQRG